MSWKQDPNTFSDETIPHLQLPSWCSTSSDLCDNELAHLLVLPVYMWSRAKKEPQSHNSRAPPNQTRVLRPIAPESSAESSAKSLSQKFFGVPFLSLIWVLTYFQGVLVALWRLSWPLAPDRPRNSEHLLCQGQISAQGILHLRNPNLGPNSAKRILDARISDPKFLGRIFWSYFFQEKRPPEKFTVEKFTSQNSPSKIQPRNRAKKIHIAPLQGHLAEDEVMKRLVTFLPPGQAGVCEESQITITMGESSTSRWTSGCISRFSVHQVDSRGL